jgi:hypothetical protein
MPDGTQVAVYSPTGEYGTIPPEQMQQALAQGYKPKDAYVEAVHPKTGQTGIIPKEQWPAASAQGYTASPREQAKQQTQQQAADMQPTPTTMDQVFKPSDGPSPAARGGYFLPQYNSAEEAAGGAKQASVGLATMGAGSLGRLAQLGMLGRAGVTGAGAAAGSMAGDVAAGKTPDMKDAAITGLAGSAGELAVGGTGAAWKAGKNAIARLSSEAPERIAELGKYFPAKQQLESAAVQAEAQSRTAFKGAYDALGVDAAPVNVASTKNAAQQAIKTLEPVASVPTPLSRVAGIPEPPPNVLTTDDPATILKELAGHDNIPFRQAQQYRSAIEQFITKNKPSATTYNALKQVSGSLSNALQSTAEREGVLKEFNAAEGMFKQHAADFWNKGAPLKSFVDPSADTKPSTLNKFLNATNDSRALAALERRGIDTSNVRAILAKGADVIKKDVPDAATLRNLGQPALDQQVGAANTAMVKKYALRTGLGLTGLGGAAGGAELIRRLANRKSK